jgi:type IV pilus assembly protein PilC
MQLNFAMAASGLFPNMAIQMTAIGEESGTLDRMLDKVAAIMKTKWITWSTT